MRNYAVRTEHSMLSIYECEVGEGVPWHRHPYSHGHFVVAGRTLVEVGEEPGVEMIPGDQNRELPANVWHRLTAIAANTIFIHCADVNQRVITEIKDAS